MPVVVVGSDFAARGGVRGNGRAPRARQTDLWAQPNRGRMHTTTDAWTFNAGLWAVLTFITNVVHPPAAVMLFANLALLVLNLDSVTKYRNAPTWVYIIIGSQVVVTMRYLHVVKMQMDAF